MKDPCGRLYCHGNNTVAFRRHAWSRRYDDPDVDSMVVTVVIRVPLAYGLAFLTRTPELPNGRYQVLWISMLVSWCMGALLTLIFL